MFNLSRWLRQFRKTVATQPRRKAKPRANRVVFRVEELEERIAPAATPGIVLAIPPTGFIGETAQFAFTFTNANSIGYAPFAQVILPATGIQGNDGITYVPGSATYLGVTVPSTAVTFNAAGQALNPYAHDAAGNPLVVTGKPGDQVVFFRGSFGSFAPGQPGATIKFNVAVSNLANLNAPLTVTGQSGFALGNDPLDDPGIDPPILGSIQSTTFTPTLFTINKVYNGPESETATGPDYPRSYTVTVDVANGQTLSNFNITDLLPSNAQFVSVTGATGNGTSTITTPSADPTGPGGNVVRQFNQIVGTAGATDAQITVNFYIPRDDAGGGQVLNPATGAPATSINNTNGSGTWTPIDLRDPTTTATASAAPVTITDRSIALQKTVVPINPGTGLPDPSIRVQPGTVLQYTVNYQVSDFYAFDQFAVTDLIGDGQDLLGSFTPTLSSSTRNGNLTTSGNFAAGNFTPPAAVNADGSQTILFGVSNELAGRGASGLGGQLLGGSVATGGTGGLPGTLPPANPDFGQTTGTITFRTIVNNSFYVVTSPNGDKSVKQGDLLNNNVSGTARLLDTRTLAPTAQTASDSSATSSSIPRGSLTKSIYAINGNTTVPVNPHIDPGDLLTYRLVYTMPLGRAESFSMTDYLPLPVFNATQVTTLDDVTSATPPVAGHAQFGPSSTYRATFGGAGNLPTLATDSSINTVTFNFPTELIATPANDVTIDMLFTVAASNLPFADGLYLTNQARYTESSTNNGSAVSDAIVQVNLGEPVLSVKKGVVATDAPVANIAFAPSPPAPVTFNAPGTAGARFSGTINNTNLANTPIDSNLTGLQASDRVTFAIVVQNTGHSGRGAFNVTIGDTLPAGFHVPASGLNLRVVNGAGTVLGFTDLGGNPISGLFGNGIQLIDPSSTQGALDTTDPITGDNIAIVTYDLQADVPGVDPNPVTALQSLSNTGAVSRYTSDPSGPNFLATPITDPATVTIQRPSTTKQLLSTSINDAANGNDNTHATIGELATYQLTITVPQGVTPNAQIVDTLPAGLAFVGMDASNPPVVSSGVTFSGSTTPVVNSPGQTITFNLGTITDSTTDSSVPETITLTYQTVVLNVASNTQGKTLRNSAVLSFTGAVNAAVQAPNVTVVLPTVNTTKTVTVNGVTNGTGDAGDPVQYTITYANPSSNSTTAYNVTVNDPIPALITGATIANVTSVGVTATTADFQLTGGAVQNTDPNGLTIQPGQSVTITVTGSIAGNAGASTTIANTATTNFTTLPGNPGQISIFNPNSTERNLSSNGSASFATASPAPTKSITSTSETSTTGSNVAIGEIVRYRLVARVPEGTNAAISLRDNLPAGMSYLNDGTTDVAFVANQAGITSSLIAGAGLQQTGNETNVGTITPTFALPAAEISGGSGTGGAFVDGDHPTFTLGDLNNADRDPDQEFVVVEFNALTDNVAGNTNGVVRNNNYTYLTGATSVATSANQPVTIVEPIISTVTKTVSPTTGDAGDTMSYQVTFTNTGSATAFDVAVSDTLPSVLQLNTASVSTSSTGTVTGISTAATSGNTARVTVTSMDPGASVTINYTAVVQIGIAPGQSVPNNARVTYTSLPGSGTSPNPTGSTTPGGSGAPDGERDGSGGLNNYTSTGNANFNGAIPSNLTKQVSATSLPQTNGNVVNIGEVATYRVSFTMPEGTSPILSLQDPLPNGITPIAARIISIGGNSTLGATSSGTPGQGIASSPLAVGSAPAGTISGQNVTFNFNGLVNNPDNVINAGDVIVVEVDGQVADNPANTNNATRTNTARLDYGAGTLSTSSSVVISEPILKAVKTPSPTHGDAGDIITYTVVVSHTAASTGPAFDVNITDPLNASLQLIPGSVTTSLGTVTTGNGGSDTTIAVNVPVLLTSQTDTITYQARLIQSLTPGTNVPNTATANFDSAPGTGRPGSTSGNASVPINSSSITGFVYVDANNDGIYQNGTETPIGSVHLVLSGTDYLNNPVSIPVNTAPDGSYSFPNLRPGTYSIVETQPTGFFDGLDTPGTLFGGTALPPPGDTISNIVIPAGSNATATNYNFGERIAADLALTKNVSNARPNVGDVITYTLTLTNNGPSAATNTTVSEAIPAGLTFQAASPSAGTSFNSAARTWTVPNLANGGIATLTVTAQVATATPLTNVATISATGQFDPVSSNNTASATETPLLADLAVSKGVSNTKPNVGDVINFTIGVVNNGPDTATNVVVNDLLPAGLQFVALGSGATQGSYVSATGVWTVGTLANTGTATLTIKAKVISSTSQNNVATVTATQFDPILANNTAQASEGPQIADLAVSKSVSNARPNVGDVITFTVGVHNNGPDGATNVTVNDLLPAGLQFVSAGTSTTQGTYNGVTGVWAVGSLANAANATLTLQARVISQNPLTNIATVTADQFDSNLSNNTAQAPETPLQAELAVTKRVSNTRPNVGDVIAFTIGVVNNGPDSATNVIVNDLLPAGLQFVAAGTSATQGTYNGVTGVWTIGTLANTGTATLTLQARVTASTVQTNVATVSAAQFDPILANNTAQAAETPQLADLLVTKTVSNSTPLLNDVITFTVQVKNNGPDTATNTVVTDPIPAGLGNVHVTTSQGAFNQGAGSWALGTLANGATATMTVTGTVTNVNAITNTATARADQFDPNLANNTATAAAQARQADLVLQKTINSQNLTWHSLATYTFTIHNNGPSAATNVVVNDPFPGSLQFVSVQSIDQGTFDPITGHWNIGTMANGQTLRLVVNFLVLNTGPIVNSASASAAEFDPNLGNNVDSVPANSVANPTTVTKGRLLASNIRRR